MINLLSWRSHWCWRGKAGGRTRWQTKNHDRNEVLRVTLYSNTVFLWDVGFDNCSIRKNNRVYRKAFRTIRLLACFRGLFVVKNISNSLTYTVASSFVCTSPFAVMTVVGLHDFVKVSISAEFKSFLLIMCIDAPESTTNARSSGLRFDGAGRHQFSEGQKNDALFFSFNFRTLLASLHAASRAPCSFYSVSSWDRSSKFGAMGLRWWGSPGQIIPSEGFWSRMSAWRTTAFVNCTHRIGFCVSELFRKIDEDFGGTISWNTLPDCRVIFNMATAHLSPFFLDLLLGCSSTWRCASEHFFPKSASILRLEEQAVWRMPFFTEWIGASSFEVVLAGPPKHSSTGTPASGTSGSRSISLILPRRKARRRIRLCRFCTLICIVTETAIVSFRTLPVRFPLPTIS